MRMQRWMCKVTKKNKWKQRTILEQLGGALVDYIIWGDMDIFKGDIISTVQQVKRIRVDSIRARERLKKVQLMQ